MSEPDTLRRTRLRSDAHRLLAACFCVPQKQVFLEDLSVVDGMQRGRNSPGFDGGRFSEVMETASHHFAQWVASSLGTSASG